MADSHANHPPEPQTPMWLPALGATLFLLAGMWWAWSSASAHTDGGVDSDNPHVAASAPANGNGPSGEPQGKPAAPAHP